MGLSNSQKSYARMHFYFLHAKKKKIKDVLVWRLLIGHLKTATYAIFHSFFLIRTSTHTVLTIRIKFKIRKHRQTVKLQPGADTNGVLRLASCTLRFAVLSIFLCSAITPWLINGAWEPNVSKLNTCSLPWRSFFFLFFLSFFKFLST